MIKLGFAVSDIGPAQVPYTCITEFNKALMDRIDINISLFYKNNIYPCLSPKFARYHIKDTVGFDGYLFATSLDTLESIINSTRAKRFFYLNDISEIIRNTDKAKELLYDHNIYIVSRCEDYFIWMTENLDLTRINLIDKVVVDFDINSILEIINI